MPRQPGAVTLAATSICITIAAQPLIAQEYVVQPGDTLRSIAVEQLGSVARWRFLCDLNADLVPDCDLIYSGMTLQLSELTTTPPDDPDTATPEAAAEPEPPVEAEPPAEPETPAESLPISNALPAYDLSRAQVGVLGEDGQLPDGWRLSFVGGAEGAAVITAVSTDYIDIAITQAGSRGAPLLQFLDGDQGITTQPGDLWAFSVEIALISGDLDENGQPLLSGTERGEDNSSLSRIRFDDNVILDAELRPIAGEAEINNADARIMNPDFRIQSSGPWTAEFRIARPVLEKR